MEILAVSILAGIEKIILSYLAFISYSINRTGCSMGESLADVLSHKLTTEFGNVGGGGA